LGKPDYADLKARCGEETHARIYIQKSNLRKTFVHCYTWYASVGANVNSPLLAHLMQSFQGCFLSRCAVRSAAMTDGGKTVNEERGAQKVVRGAG
jgi:hypothetical protein